MSTFKWPDNVRAAVSLTFDDARASQVDNGFPILEAYDAKATFYVTLHAMEKRLDEWQQAAKHGHEIGNHTVTHPCSCNFSFARKRALEDYTLEQMEEELTGASEKIEQLFGAPPSTFAYPCGQKYVGRGQSTASYVPLVARHFLAGRGYMDESENCPWLVDLAQTMGRPFDGFTFEELLPQIERAVEQGGWLVLAGHDVGTVGRQSVLPDALHAICRYAKDPANGIWLDTAHEIACYIKAWQNEK